ncbi:MAG: hypothetical protein H0V66_10855, partial [Bdellovibrionales bacterium]|nr:hypothetical protein [Bdellovibrionales bacterium]
MKRLKIFLKNAEKQEDTDYYKGYFMKHKKLPSLLALSISLELIISPMPALADNNNVLNSVQGAVNLGMQAYGIFRPAPQPQMPPHMATDLAAFKKQQTPLPDKHFTMANMMKLPGMDQYIARNNADPSKKAINPQSLECTTMPSSLSKPDNEVCRNEKVSEMTGNPKMQADEAFAYYNQFKTVKTTYENFKVKSNVGGQAYGDGCMADAMAVLKGYFADRLKQLDNKVVELDAAVDMFEEQSEMDLKSIRESSAILNGEGSAFGSEFANSDIFDYGKRFGNPACNSILAKDGMDALGKKGGLKGIEEKMVADFGATPQGSQYSPATYLENHAAVEKDIRKMADEVGEQAKFNFANLAKDQKGYSDFLSGIGGSVTSNSGAKMGLNASFFTGLQNKFTATRKTLSDKMGAISTELGGRGGEAMSHLTNIDNDSTFEAELGSLENRIKGDCVNSSGIDTALSRIYDPSLSKAANKHSSQLIKKRIKAIIGDLKMSPEKKLAELEAIEGKGGANYQMKMDADYETQDVKADGTLIKKTVNAAGNVSPRSYFTDVIKNCEAQFQVNKLNNKFSAKEAIKQLRSLKKDYQKEAKKHSKEIRDEIVNKMIDCKDNGGDPNSSKAGSCSPATLDMSNSKFCAKAAFSCSKNMKQCTDKA